MQTFNVNNLNELTSVTRNGTLTVAGTATERKAASGGDPPGVTGITVSGTGLTSGSAELYENGAWAREGAAPADGENSYTATAQDSYGRQDSSAVTVNLPANNTFVYDLNGNLRTNNTRIFDYDDENQLIRVTEPGAWKSEFSYDGLLRRRIRKEFTWSSAVGNWLLTNEVRYVYDGKLVIQERNNQNLPQVTYTRGNDLSGSLQGAGGIGGLLARTENPSTLDSQPSTSAHAYYHADGNGNVTALVNTNGRMMARYSYDPYGNVLTMSGPLAEANLYRFSSKEWHEKSGLAYYLYRYYSPNLQRWPNQDPLGDIGNLPGLTAAVAVGFEHDSSAAMSSGEIVALWSQINLNLYRSLGNNPSGYVDFYGLSCEPTDLLKLKEVQDKIREAYKYLKGSESAAEKRMVQHELQELFKKERLLKSSIERARRAAELARNARVARLGRGGLIVAAGTGGYVGGRYLGGSTPYEGGGTLDENVQEAIFVPFWDWWFGYGCTAP